MAPTPAASARGNSARSAGALAVRSRPGSLPPSARSQRSAAGGSGAARTPHEDLKSQASSRGGDSAQAQQQPWWLYGQNAEERYKAAASFYDAHNVQFHSKFRNAGGARAPFASDEPEHHDSPVERRTPLPRAVSHGDLLRHVRPLPPVGGVHQAPLPTAALDRTDSYRFSCAVRQYSHRQNRGGNQGCNIITWAGPPPGGAQAGA